MTVYYTVTADIIFNTRGISVSESDHTDVILIMNTIMCVNSECGQSANDASSCV